MNSIIDYFSSFVSKDCSIFSYSTLGDTILLTLIILTQFLDLYEKINNPKNILFLLLILLSTTLNDEIYNPKIFRYLFTILFQI